jgi:hypothetical protein
MQILSAKRETFCLLLVSGKTMIESYRQSRPVGTMNDQTVAQRAKELLKRPQVLARIAELRLPAALEVRKAYKYTLDAALRECDQAYALALALGQPSVMVSAITVKAKIAGLVIDKREERHGLLDDVTTRQLLQIRAMLTDRTAPGPRAVIELLPDQSEKSVRESSERGTSRFLAPDLGPTE